MFKNLKNKTISFTLKQIINFKIKEYGEMLKLNLDSENKKIDLEVMLIGEKEPLSVQVESYEIIQKENKYFLVAKNIKTSREWINIVAKNFLENQEFEIPKNLADTLKIII